MRDLDIHLTTSFMPVLTFSLALDISVREKRPESMPFVFHIYTPSATPKPKMPGLQSSDVKLKT